MNCPPVVHYADGSEGQLSVLFNYAGELAVARLIDTTSEGGYSDPRRRVIKPPLREVGNSIHHGGNEMKMNSIRFSLTNAACGSTVTVPPISGRSKGQERRVELVSFWELSYLDNPHTTSYLWEYSPASCFSTHRLTFGQRICDCSFSLENISSTCDLRQLLQFPFPPPAVHHGAGLIISRT